MSADAQLTQACQRCWRRKQKCGRQRPDCAECLRAEAPCVPRVWGRVLEGSTDPILNGTASARSLIEQMKQRIVFLESLEGASDVQSHGRLSSPIHGPELTHTDSNTSNRPAHTDQGFMEHAANEVGYLSVAAMGEPDRLDMDIRNSPSFATLVQEATKLSPDLILSRRLISDSSDASHGVSLLAIQEDLVTLCRCDLRFFIDVYCGGVGQIFPCVSKASCDEVLDLALEFERERALPPGQRATSEAIILTCFTVSLGILNSVHCRTAQQPLQRLMAGAMTLLPTVVGQASDIEALRFLLLASILCLHRFEEASSWHLVGLAVTKAISAGLHRNRKPESNDDDSSTLFWTLYKLDRAFAFALDRPFSIEDGDMTIQLPQAASLHATGLPAMDLQSFSVWAVHYSHMLSGWRRQLLPNVEACYSSFLYWRETCQEFVVSSQLDTDSVTVEHRSVSIIVAAAEAQLTCGALVHLFLRSLESPSPPPSFLNRLITGLEHEVPQFLTKYKAAMDIEALGSTILDAYDIIGAVTVYICSRRTFLPAQSQSHERSGTVTLGVPGMKLVTLCMSILQKMATRFEPMFDLQELLWCFLSALESHEQPAAGLHTLKQALSKCRVPIPRHLALLMERAVA